MKKSGESDWLGLTGTKFVSDADMLDNGSRVSSRECYCKDVECMPSGVLNVSSCKYGAPAFVSLPHFYLADETYRKNISGMNPKKEEHEFTLIVQPVNKIIFSFYTNTLYFKIILPKTILICHKTNSCKIKNFKSQFIDLLNLSLLMLLSYFISENRYSSASSRCSTTELFNKTK